MVPAFLPSIKFDKDFPAGLPPPALSFWRDLRHFQDLFEAAKLLNAYNARHNSFSPASPPNMSYTSNALLFKVSQVDMFIFTSPRVCGRTPPSVVSIDHALHDFSGLSRRVGVQLQL